jgi:HD-GYP domain-containing protein (c-di-GMP phosphodiesterase class II)
VTLDAAGGPRTDRTALANRLARVVELSTSESETLEQAVALYDLGRVGVLDAIWEKTGPLSSEERRSVESHSVLGASLLSRHQAAATLVPAILYHHERFDGTGYPQGLRGAEIPVLARIIHVVDAYFAMTQARPYRPALSHRAATAELRRLAGRQFDPELVRAFVQA